MRSYVSIFRGDKPDGVFLQRVRRSKQLMHRVEQDGNLLVMFFDLAGKVPVGSKDLAELYKGAHDSDVDLDGTLAAERAGKHGDAVLGEGVRGMTPAAPT